MNKILLAVLDVFSALFRMSGVNYPQLRAIVSVKLAMDNRRQIVTYRRKGDAEPQNAFSWTLVFYGLLGVFIAMAMYGIASFSLAMLTFFSYIMVMVAMTLITDFSSVLLDTSDNTIILPRPVDSRTLFAARMTHILLYLGQITLSLAIFPSAAVLVKYGVTALTFFLINTALAVLMAVLVTNAVYLLILLLASEEKLKNMINYFQIAMAVFIMGGYQLLPRIAGRLGIEQYNPELAWMHLAVPPAWMAAWMEMVHFQLFDALHLTFTALAVAVPACGFYVVNRYLTPVFTNKLGSIAGDTSIAAKVNGTPLVAKLSAWFTRSALERAAFEFIYRMLARDRKIKLKVYPAFGYVIIFGVIFMLQGKRDLAGAWEHLPSTNYHLVLIYLTFLILQVALSELPYADDFKASWIYFAAPIPGPGPILAGSLKAIAVRLFFPAYFAVAVFTLVVWGTPIMGDLLFGLLNNGVMLLIICLVNKRTLPFSLAPNLRSQAGTFARSLMLVIMVGLLGVLHYFISENVMLLMSAIPVQLLVLATLYRRYANTGWQKISF